jgi:hypothetical protein
MAASAMGFDGGAGRRLGLEQGLALGPERVGLRGNV